MPTYSSINRARDAVRRYLIVQRYLYNILYTTKLRLTSKLTPSTQVVLVVFDPKDFKKRDLLGFRLKVYRNLQIDLEAEILSRSPIGSAYRPEDPKN
jgi:hypothetical protein